MTVLSEKGGAFLRNVPCPVVNLGLGSAKGRAMGAATVLSEKGPSYTAQMKITNAVRSKRRGRLANPGVGPRTR